MPDMQTNESVEAAKRRLAEIESQKDSNPDKAAKDGARDISEIIHAPKKPPKKKGFGAKLKESIFGENLDNRGIAEHIFFDIFIPRTKQILSDMANSAINSALNLGPGTRTLNGGNSHQANASIYNRRAQERMNSVRSIRRNVISEQTWDGETAADIYSQMMEILDSYPALSLANVYSMMGFSEQIRATDYDWGWTSPDGLEPVQVNRAEDIWIFDLPPTKRI